MTAVINIANEFSKFPAGRYLTDGPHSGQAFREKLLVPNLKDENHVTVELDGVIGYGSSFLEEAFGGLIREGFTIKQLQTKLEISSKKKSLVTEVWNYINDASAR